MKQTQDIKTKLFIKSKLKAQTKQITHNQYCVLPTKTMIGLYTSDLDKDIVYTLHSKALDRSAMIRELDDRNMQEFCKIYFSKATEDLVKQPITMFILTHKNDFSHNKVEQLIQSITQNSGFSNLNIIEKYPNEEESKWHDIVFDACRDELYDGHSVPEQIAIGRMGTIEFVSDSDMAAYMDAVL